MLSAVVAVGPNISIASAAPTPPATPHLDKVVEAIQTMESATGSDSTRGILWSVTDDNTLPGAGLKNSSWLTRTQSCWGAVVACSSSTVQQRLLTTIRRIVASGRTLVDVSSLTKLPYDAFRQAIIDGAADGEAAGHAPTIRLLWGRTPITLFTDGISVDKNLAELRDQVQAAAPHAKVIAALQSDTPVLNGYSWNHSKIVAADGRVALAIGINLWEKSYLQSSNPVTDLGVTVEGPAAARASRFLDELWTYVCAHPGKGPARWNTVIGTSSTIACPAALTPNPQKGTGDVRVLSVGRSGYISNGRTSGRTPWFQPSFADRYDSRCIVPPVPNPMNGDAAWDGRNPSDTALRALVDSATTKVVIGQQEMTFPCSTSASYDLRLIDAIARKVAAGVQVDIVVSNPNSNINSTEDYLADPNATKTVVMKRLTKLLGSSQAASDAACRSLMIAPLRVSASPTWPNGKEPALHGKVIAVDDAAFYIGSQNAYPNQLPEFGYIIEDQKAMRDLRRLYLDPMVQYSSAAALPCG